MLSRTESIDTSEKAVLFLLTIHIIIFHHVSGLTPEFDIFNWYALPK